MDGNIEEGKNIDLITAITRALGKVEFDNLCKQYYKEEVVDAFFADSDPYRSKVEILVEFCERQNKIDTLIEHIQEKNGNFANIWAGHAPTSPLSAFQSARAKYDQKYENIGDVRQNPSLERAPDSGPAEHPLAGTPEKIQNWFAELEPEGQVFVVVAALFAGMERRDFLDVYDLAIKQFNIVLPEKEEADQA